MRASTTHRLQVGGRQLDYRVVRSTAAKKLRIRVRPDGVEVVQPETRNGEEVSAFVERNKHWILDQVRRIERFRYVRRPEQTKRGELLYRGLPTRVRLEAIQTQRRGSTVQYVDDEIVLRSATLSGATVARSLENWLRKQARAQIQKHLSTVCGRLGRSPQRVYVMGQRTKWGNCSAAKNLSFNWRLILAPDFVLRYLVTHEAVHLAIPDHSRKFWLTVQSLCRDTERAKQWLSANGQRLLRPLPIANSVHPT